MWGVLDDIAFEKNLILVLGRLLTNRQAWVRVQSQGGTNVCTIQLFVWDLSVVVTKVYRNL